MGSPLRCKGNLFIVANSILLYSTLSTSLFAPCIAGCPDVPSARNATHVRTLHYNIGELYRVLLDEMMVQESLEADSTAVMHRAGIQLVNYEISARGVVERQEEAVWWIVSNAAATVNKSTHEPR